MMMSRIYWINRLPKPVRDRAWRNAESYAKKYSKNFTAIMHQRCRATVAIVNAFAWKETPEGFNYWYRVSCIVSKLTAK